MAYKKYTRKPKRTTRKKYVKKAYRSRMTNMLRVPFPTAFNCSLKYSDYFSVSQSGGGVPKVQQYRMNSLYDPDYTNTGHQPYYFDQLCNSQMYNRYTVYGVRLKLTASSNYPTELLVRGTNLSTVPTNMSLEDERPGGVSRFVIPTAKATVITKYFSCAYTAGVSKSKYANDDNYSSAYNNSPVLPSFINILFMNPNITATSTVDMNVELTFYARLYDRIPVGQS